MWTRSLFYGYSVLHDRKYGIVQYQAVGIIRSQSIMSNPNPYNLFRRPALRLHLCHLLLVLFLKLLDRLIPIILHHPLLLEVFHLYP